jgi:hypothetical protein
MWFSRTTGTTLASPAINQAITGAGVIEGRGGLVAVSPIRGRPSSKWM